MITCIRTLCIILFIGGLYVWYNGIMLERNSLLDELRKKHE
jgi:hypothetical protein